jgi:hypothetical protein
MIVWAAQTRVHYMFLVSRCRCNSLVTAIREALDDSRRRPRPPRVGLTGICNIASAHPPFNLSLQKRTGIAGPGFDAGFGGLVDRS